MQSLLRLFAVVTFVTSAPLAAQIHAEEDRDYGVAPVASLRLEAHHAPTPLDIPGAKRILTEDLRSRLWLAEPPLLFDVLGGEQHDSLPGAIWLPGAGRGESFSDAVQAQLAKVLEQATQGNRQRALVFFCANSSCWLSYNSALRAALLGYKEVYWYRGGIDAWLAAGESLAPLKVTWRRPPG